MDPGINPSIDLGDYCTGNLLSETVGEATVGDWETGRLGDWETGRLGDWETGRLGDWETGRLGGLGAAEGPRA
jgi:hypothetical protein